ncbi:hypothetical protein [Pseudomonas fluorescens]|uniref:hypothetical protein n=1 Tax=Pseudomonas fluorescens TaxID=294 RepID=UPI0012D7FBAD|nr:hypothetical protein [Pseudomonas fluorescens]
MIDSVKLILSQQLKVRNSIIQMIVSLISDKNSDQRKRFESSRGAGQSLATPIKSPSPEVSCSSENGLG